MKKLEEQLSDMDSQLQSIVNSLPVEIQKLYVDQAPNHFKISDTFNRNCTLIRMEFIYNQGENERKKNKKTEKALKAKEARIRNEKAAITMKDLQKVVTSIVKTMKSKPKPKAKAKPGSSPSNPKRSDTKKTSKSKTKQGNGHPAQKTHEQGNQKKRSAGKRIYI